MNNSLLTSSLIAGSLLLVGCGGGDSDEEDSGGRTSSGSASISMNPTDVQEGSNNDDLTVQVSLSERLDTQVSINYTTRDGTAVAGEDYESTSGKLIIPKGSRRGTFDVVIIGDGIDEVDEFFVVELSNPVNAKLASSDATASFTINNDDEPPEFTFETRQQSVSEDLGTAKVYAELSEVSGNTVSAHLSMSGTALNNDDYSLDTPAVIEFGPGEVRSSIDVEVQPDSIPEGGETITFEIDRLENAAVADRSGVSEHSIIILGDTALNDTGLETYTDGASAGLTLEPSSHPGQDASFGRDSQSEPDFDGHQGFSFTKLDADGNPLPSNSPQWSCTRDNVTGAVWENKQAATSLAPVYDPQEDESIRPAIGIEEFRAENFRYAWRVNDEETNGGGAGHAETREQQLSSSRPTSENCAFGEDGGRRDALYCNTRTYLNEMNRLGTCGFQDWRMPTIEELRSVANYEVQDNSSTPDDRFFSGIETGVRYLSGTPAADNSAAAWCFDYDNGEVKLCQKTPNQYRGFMAVRSPE